MTTIANPNVNTTGLLEIKTKVQDMSDEDMTKLKDIVSNAFTSFKTESDIAACIKKKLDTDLIHASGAGWNVVVGKNFGSHVFYQTKKYAYLNIADQYILVWKS